MKKVNIIKIKISLIIFLITIILLSGCINNNNNNDRVEYVKDIKRNADDSQEEKLIDLAENINYSVIFGITRYTESNESEPFNEKMMKYSIANFIDKTGLNYYEKRIDYLIKNDVYESAGITYHVDVDFYSKINIDINNEKIVLNENGNTYYDNSFSGQSQIGINNNSQYIVYNAKKELSFSRELNDINIVKMSLTYGERSGHKEGFLIEQLIIFNDTDIPEIIILNPQWAVIS